MVRSLGNADAEEHQTKTGADIAALLLGPKTDGSGLGSIPADVARDACTYLGRIDGPDVACTRDDIKRRSTPDLDGQLAIFNISKE